MNSENITKKMKIEVEKFKKIFNQMDNPEPDRDWFVIILILIIIFIIVTAWSIALYFLYFPKEPVVQTVTASYGTVDEKKISSVLSAYEDRKKAFESLQKNPPVFVDPSI